MQHMQPDVHTPTYTQRTESMHCRQHTVKQSTAMRRPVRCSCESAEQSTPAVQRQQPPGALRQPWLRVQEQRPRWRSQRYRRRSTVSLGMRVIWVVEQQKYPSDMYLFKHFWRYRVRFSGETECLSAGRWSRFVVLFKMLNIFYTLANAQIVVELRFVWCHKSRLYSMLIVWLCHVRARVYFKLYARSNWTVHEICEWHYSKGDGVSVSKWLVEHLSIVRDKPLRIMYKRPSSFELNITSHPLLKPKAYATTTYQPNPSCSTR